MDFEERVAVIARVMRRFGEPRSWPSLHARIVPRVSFKPDSAKISLDVPGYAGVPALDGMWVSGDITPLDYNEKERKAFRVGVTHACLLFDDILYNKRYPKLRRDEDDFWERLREAVELVDC